MRSERIPRAPAVERRYIEIDSVCIYYQVAGAGPPVVLVHGLSGSGRWWARNIAALADSFHLHVIDLIGFGESRAGHRFVLGEAADYLVRWLDRLAIPRASVVGHSMGGFIAADLAAHHPDRVDRLMLVDAVALPFSHSYWQQALGLAQGLWRLPLGFVPVLLADAYRAGPRTILKAARELLTSDLRPMLARIQTPTLVVWGERDSVVPIELGERLTACLPNARFRVIPGAGHNPMWDRPAEFNRAALDFLAPDPAGPRRNVAREQPAPSPRR
jgi:pimeloyl-ACP methyl ester carboxylesterase